MAKSNKQIQKECDKLKWESSEFMGKDMSGRMDYCDYCNDGCPFADEYAPTLCYLTQEEREQQYACAKADKAMKKAKQESK